MTDPRLSKSLSSSIGPKEIWLLRRLNDALGLGSGEAVICARVAGRPARPHGLQRKKTCITRFKKGTVDYEET